MVNVERSMVCTVSIVLAMDTVLSNVHLSLRSNYVAVWDYDPELQQVMVSMGGRMMDMETMTEIMDDNNNTVSNGIMPQDKVNFV